MNSWLCALALVLFLPFVARASCGTVNGVQVCTDNPNCAFGNGVEVCTTPTNCGWVASESGDGQYTCLSNATSGSLGSSLSQGSSSGGGSSSSSGGSSKTDAPVLAGVQSIATWLNGSGDSGSTGWFKSAVGWTIQKVAIYYIYFKIDMLKWGWGIAKGILQTLDVTSAIDTAIQALPAKAAALLMYCKVPDALNLLLAAFATAFVWRWLP